MQSLSFSRGRFMRKGLFLKNRPFLSPRFGKRERAYETISQEHKVLELEDLPGPKSYPIFGTFFDFMKRGGIDRWSEADRERHLDYGPIYKQDVFKFLLVGIADPNDAQKLLQSDGKYPVGSTAVLWPLEKYFVSRGVSSNDMIMFSKGKDWKKLRSNLQKNFFSPQDAASYLPSLSEVTEDASNRVVQYSSNMNEFVCKATMELFSMILFNKRLDIWDENNESRDWIFAKNIFSMMGSLSNLVFGSPFAKMFPSLFSDWRRFCKEMDSITEYTQSIVQENLQKLRENPNDPNMKDTYLMKLLTSSDLTVQQIEVGLYFMLFASVDTTASSVLWTLYNLSTNQEAQEKLANELHSHLKGRQLQTAQDIETLRYMRDCVRESFRLNPSTGGFQRTLKQDIVLQGYHLPAGTTVSYCSQAFQLDPKYFEDPLSYKPERWSEEARQERKKKGTNAIHDHLLLSAPFGMGPRMCIGARIAQIEIYTLISALIQKYHVELDPPNQEIGRLFRLVTRPNPTPTFKFTPRKWN